MNVVDPELQMFFERCDVKHLFSLLSEISVLENQREILHTLLSVKKKITVNRIFNFISTKKLF